MMIKLIMNHWISHLKKPDPFGFFYVQNQLGASRWEFNQVDKTPSIDQIKIPDLEAVHWPYTINWFPWWSGILINPLKLDDRHVTSMEHCRFVTLFQHKFWVNSTLFSSGFWHSKSWAWKNFWIIPGLECKVSHRLIL